MGTRLLGSDRTLACLPELLNHPRITSKVFLATNKDDGQTSTEMHNLGDPLQKGVLLGGTKRGLRDTTDLLLYVVQRVRRVNGKTDKNDMRVRVAERPEPVIVFLTSSIP